MSSVNKVILIGRLGKDPEVKSLAGGNSVAQLSLATDHSWTDKSGQRQEKTEWHRVVVWGRDAENAGKYLGKGRMVYVEGRLETREYQDKDGQRRFTTEVVAQQLTYLDRSDAQQGAQKPRGQRQAQASTTGQERGYGGGWQAPRGAPAQAPAPATSGPDFNGDDDLPF